MFFFTLQESPSDTKRSRLSPAPETAVHHSERSAGDQNLAFETPVKQPTATEPKTKVVLALFVALNLIQQLGMKTVTQGLMLWSNPSQVVTRDEEAAAAADESDREIPNFVIPETVPADFSEIDDEEEEDEKEEHDEARWIFLTLFLPRFFPVPI